MLQRTGTRPPSPLKSYPNDGTIFNKDGKLKEQYHKLCQEININPEELYPRDLESFREPNTSRNVQILRFNNFENKRRAKLEALRAVAKQRNIIPPSKPARPGTTSPRSRTMSFPNNPESMSNIDKESHRPPRPPTRDFSSNLHTKASGEGLQAHGRRSIYDTSPLLSAGYARGSPGRKEVSAEKMKGIDSSYVIDADECYMMDDMEEKFKRYIKQKEKQKERMLNASTLVTRRDEEYREELKKAYQAKVDKWNKKREAMSKKKKQNNDEEEYRKEKIERQREAQRETQRALFERVQNKMEKSTKQKQNEIEKRVSKLARLNTTFQERYFSCLEKKEADSSGYLEDALVEIENKFMSTGFRKRKFIEEKKVEATRHLEGIEERRQKVKEEKEEESKVRLEKLIAKMEKERCKSATPAKKKIDKGPRPIEENTEYMERMEEKNIKENETEKQKLDSFKEKEKKIAIKLQQRKNNMSELIAERRELWNQKLESINENKEIANEASEKYLEQKMRTYKERVEQIQRMKEERKRQLAKLNRTFA